MEGAVATLQKTARRLQLAGELDRSKYSRIMAQLREVTDVLTPFENGGGRPQTVDFSGLLRTVSAAAQPGDGALALEVPDGLTVEGPEHDLRDLMGSLIEYAGSGGGDALALRTRIKRREGEAGASCATELTVHAPDLPDFLRRRLWDAARLRRGEVSLVCEAERCRIELALPLVA